MQYSYLAAALFALVGIVLASIAYTAPLGNTGVDGSIGALLAVVGAISTGAGALIVMLARTRGGLETFVVGLSILAAALTAFAAYFLMQFLLAAVMAGACLCLVLALVLNSRRRPA